MSQFPTSQGTGKLCISHDVIIAPRIQPCIPKPINKENLYRGCDDFGIPTFLLPTDTCHWPRPTAISCMRVRGASFRPAIPTGAGTESPRTPGLAIFLWKKCGLVLARSMRSTQNAAGASLSFCDWGRSGSGGSQEDTTVAFFVCGKLWPIEDGEAENDRHRPRQKCNRLNEKIDLPPVRIIASILVACSPLCLATSSEVSLTLR